MVNKIKPSISRIKKLLYRSSSNPPPADTHVASIQPAPKPLNPSSLLTTASSNPEAHGDSQSPSLAPILPVSLPTERGVNYADWSEIKAFANLLSKGAGMFGPLKKAVDGILLCFETFESVVQGREDYRMLKNKLNTLFRDLSGYFGGSAPPVMTSSILNLAQGIEQEITSILQKQQQSELGRYLRAKEAADEILECYRRVQWLLERLALNANINVWKTVDEQATESRLKNLPNSPAAKYRSAGSSALRRNGCTPNTRIQVLEELRDWAFDDQSQRIYWLNGMAGTGKTTIAYTLCEQLESTRKLAASFFCSRQLPACRDVNRIVPTISYQLSRFSRPFRYAVSQALEEDPDIHNQSLAEQFQQLIVEPLSRVKNTLPAGLIVTIDALDECDNNESVGEILEVVLLHAQDLPIKFFVTSRPDAHILDRMREEEGDRIPVELRLHELEHSIVQDDIKIYLTTKLGSRMNLATHDLDTLVERSGVLFIYAATVVRYIEGGNFCRSAKRLKEVLNVSGGSSNDSDKEIDALYTAILKAAFDDPTLTSSDQEEMRLILHTVICAQEPLSVDVVAGLLALDSETSVQAALRPLLSVLQVSDVTRSITTLHQSFPNYLLDKRRSGAFHCDGREHNARVAQLCFDQINIPDPPFNICNLGSSYVFDEDIPDLQARVEDAISKELFYACRYWGAHVMLATDSWDLARSIYDFLSYRLLLWAEVMNLRKSIGSGTRMLYEMERWSQNAGSLDESTKNLLRDAWMFTTSFSSSPISRSTPHIYVSTLSFWPEHRPVTEHYLQKSPRLITGGSTAMLLRRILPLASFDTGQAALSIAYSSDGAYIASSTSNGIIHIRDTSTGQVIGQPLDGHTGFVWSVAYSPDGARIVSGSGDCTIRIWDAHTGRAVGQPLEGHTDDVWSVAYSLNGAQIASGSSDYTVRIWDACTGQVIGLPLKGHAGTVRSVAYSPDSAHIVSGSIDSTVRIWDARTGQMVGQPLIGHTNAVASVAYSSNGAYIISGSHDRTIRIWDPRTGQAVGKPLKGHTDAITNVACSPDSAHIVSACCDNTICIWAANTDRTSGRPLGAHTSYVSSVAYSPNGAYIVSGSYDNRICIWDSQAGQAAGRSLDFHARPICSVAYSPDSVYIASGSEDNTVRIWNSHTCQATGQPMSGHTNTIHAVAYSPDGASIASGSKDGTIRIWDARSCQAVGRPLEGHTASIHSVAYSSDGERVVSGSNDKTICVWDVRTGQTIGPPLMGHTAPVYSVVYSGDGARIASGSVDRSVRIWDACTGQMIGQPLQGHTQTVYAVAYSPDGACIISGSEDKTIRIWNPLNGQMIGQPLKGHTYAVTSVAYSLDGEYIVSADHTIRIWNARTGQAIGEPLKGHTNSVRSVAYSPDGARIVSCSGDKTIRIWDTQTIGNSIAFEKSQTTDHSHDNLHAISNVQHAEAHICNPGCRLDGPHKVWTIDTDGWVVVDGSKLLVWVPPDLQDTLVRPQNAGVISRYGFLQLDFDHRRMGEHWQDHFRPEKPTVQ